MDSVGSEEIEPFTAELKSVIDYSKTGAGEITV